MDMEHKNLSDTDLLKETLRMREEENYLRAKRDLERERREYERAQKWWGRLGHTASQVILPGLTGALLAVFILLIFKK
jgi:hypothetical protein